MFRLLVSQALSVLPVREVRCFLLLCRLWQNNNLGVWAVRYLRGVKYMMRKIYYYEKHEKIKFI